MTYLSSSFKAYTEKTEDDLKGVSKLKDNLDKYVDHHSFKSFKD